MGQGGEGRILASGVWTGSWNPAGCTRSLRETHAALPPGTVWGQWATPGRCHGIFITSIAVSRRLSFPTWNVRATAPPLPFSLFSFPFVTCCETAGANHRGLPSTEHLARRVGRPPRSGSQNAHSEGPWRELLLRGY